MIETRVTLEGKVQLWGNLFGSEPGSYRFTMPPPELTPKHIEDLLAIHFSPDDPRRYKSSRMVLEGIRIDNDVAVIFVDETADINDALFEALRDHQGSASRESLARLVDAAEVRKRRLLTAITSNPAGVVRRALSEAERNSFPSEVTPLLERRVDLEGGLTVMIADNFEERVSSVSYFLFPLDAKPPPDYSSAFKLDFVPAGPRLISGTKVRLRGVQIDRHVVVPLTEPGAFEVTYMAQPGLKRRRDQVTGGSPPKDERSRRIEEELKSELHRAATAMEDAARRHTRDGLADDPRGAVDERGIDEAAASGAVALGDHREDAHGRDEAGERRREHEVGRGRDRRSRRTSPTVTVRSSPGERGRSPSPTR